MHVQNYRFSSVPHHRPCIAQYKLLKKHTKVYTALRFYEYYPAID